MIRPYWFSEDRWSALGLLLVVVSLTLGMVFLSVLLNRWNNDFFSALQDKNAAALPGLMQLGFGAITVGSILPEPRAGNPKPRLIRYPGQQSMLNCYGLPSIGLEACLANLRRRRAVRW